MLSFGEAAGETTHFTANAIAESTPLPLFAALFGLRNRPPN
jgi:hypothetical protein